MTRQGPATDAELGGSQVPFTSDMARLLAIASAACAILVVSMSVYTSAVGSIPFTLHRSYALVLCALVVVLGGNNLLSDIRSRSARRTTVPLAFDALLIAVFSVAAVRFPMVLERIENEFYVPGTWDIVLAFAGLAALLEIGRRVWGVPLLLVTLAFLAYLVFGEYLPSVVAHRPISWANLSTTFWYGYQGVFSTMLGIVLNVVVVYVLFGTLLESTGAGDVLLRIAFATAGSSRGGPAHGAIIASSLFGTMSGSTIANVVGTGTFTIPMMKKRGFQPEFAGGVEATASSGGQIVPPIMGAAAFVMADMIGMPYLAIATAALVPALLYYFNLYIGVAFEARKRNIRPIPAAERLKITRNDLVRSLQFIIPTIVVVAVMISGRSVAYAGFCATVAAVLAGLVLNSELRREPRRLVDGAIRAGRNASGVVIAVAMMGVIIGTMDATGAGLKFAGYIGQLGEGNLFLSLVLAMIGVLLLGMGMPTLPAYLITILVLGPAIEVMGLTALTAHMFVFYYGVASSITPPVALAAYAAAAIAGGNPLMTGVMAVRLGLAKFLVPFVFAYNPVLLMVETFDPLTFALTMGRTLLSFWLITSALARFERTSLSAAETVLRLVAGLLLLLSWEVTQFAGLMFGTLLIVLHSARAAQLAAAAASKIEG